MHNALKHVHAIAQVWGKKNTTKLPYAGHQLGERGRKKHRREENYKEERNETKGGKM